MPLLPIHIYTAMDGGRAASELCNIDQTDASLKKLATRRHLCDEAGFSDAALFAFLESSKGDWEGKQANWRSHFCLARSQQFSEKFSARMFDVSLLFAIAWQQFLRLQVQNRLFLHNNWDSARVGRGKLKQKSSHQISPLLPRPAPRAHDQKATPSIRLGSKYSTFTCHALSADLCLWRHYSTAAVDIEWFVMIVHIPESSVMFPFQNRRGLSTLEPSPTLRLWLLSLSVFRGPWFCSRPSVRSRCTAASICIVVEQTNT